MQDPSRKMETLLRNNKGWIIKKKTGFLRDRSCPRKLQAVHLNGNLEQTNQIIRYEHFFGILKSPIQNVRTYTKHM